MSPLARSQVETLLKVRVLKLNGVFLSEVGVGESAGDQELDLKSVVISGEFSRARLVNPSKEHCAK